MSTGFSFQPLGQNCPVCGGISRGRGRGKADCRQSGNLVFCRTGLEIAPPSGWVLRKIDPHGFGIFVEGGETLPMTEELRAKLQQKREDRERMLAQIKQEQANSCSLDRRNHGIRSLHKHWGLAPSHCADLKKRRLTPFEIDKLHFFSIQPQEILPPGVDHNLPGVAQWGKIALRKGKDGTHDAYACPVWNPYGQMVSWQSRLMNPDSDKGCGKYLWATRSHLSNGEIPITFVRPVEGQVTRPTIGMCEGILKPAIAAQKLKQIFIGASGANFASSPEQLREYLAVASAELNTKVVTWYPDAAAVQNPQVIGQYRRTWDLIESWGYRIQIAWWGQTDKAAGDCDEIDPATTHISILTLKEFQLLCKVEGSWRNANTKSWHRWRQRRLYNAEIVELKQWVSWDAPPDGSIFFGRAGLGAGKTTRLKAWVKQWKEQGQRRFYVLGYRNTLLLQTAAKLGFYHIHDGDARILLADEDTSFCLCVDSLMRIKVEEFDGAILLLDEICSVILHLLSSKTIQGYRRNEILAHIAEAFRRSRLVVCLDGLLKEPVVSYVHTLAPQKQVIRAVNKFDRLRAPMTLLLGSQGLEEKVKVNDKSAMIAAALTAPMPVICSDSQIFVEAMELLILARNPEAKVLRVDSKTVNEEYVKEFLSDGNKYILDNEIEYLLYSPSAESGLDVSIPNWFSHHFGFFFGVQAVDAIIQMMGRLRCPYAPKFIWVKEFSNLTNSVSHSYAPGGVRAAFLETLFYELGNAFDIEDWDSKEEASKKLQSLIEENIFENVHNRMTFTLMAQENFEKANLRECLFEALKTEGYNVRYTITPTDYECKELIKEATEEVKQRNSHDIFTAPVADEEIEILASQLLAFDAKWEDRCKRKHARLCFDLPGIRHTSSWNEEFIYRVFYKERDLIRQCEMYWLYCNSLELEKIKAERRLHAILRSESTDAGYFVGDVRSRFARISLLKTLGFDQFFSATAIWNAASPQLVAFAQRCSEPKNAAILGCRPGKDLIKFINRLLGWFGRELKSLNRSSEGVRNYQLSLLFVEDKDVQNILACLDRRYGTDLAKIEKPDWVSALNLRQIQAQTEALTYSPDTTAPDPVSINKQASGAVIPELHIDNTQNLAYSPDTTAPDPVNINKTALGAVRKVPLCLVKKSQEAPSEKTSTEPLPLPKIRPVVKPTPKENRLAVARRVMAFLAASLTTPAAAIASPAAASPSPVEVSAVPPQAVSSQVLAARPQLPSVGTRVEVLSGEYKGRICVVESVKNKMIWASPEGRFPKPALGYFSDEVRILVDQNPPDLYDF
jgi:hypothetical protein